LDPALYASAGTFLPGDSADFLLIQVAAPSPSLGSLPSTVTFSLRGYESTSGAVATPVADDTIGLGLATGGILTANAAQELWFGSAPGVRTWTISTAGITLAQLNAGQVYVYVGFTAIPGSSSAFSSSNWTVGVSPTSPQVVTGGLSLSSSEGMTASATWIGGGGAPSYVPLSLTATAIAYGTSVFPVPLGYTASASLNNGLGDVASGTIQAPTYDGGPPSSLEATGSLTVFAKVSVGVGSYTVTETGSMNITMGPAGEMSVLSFGLTASVVSPSAAELYLDQASLTYTMTHGGPVSSSLPHQIQRLVLIPDYGVSIL
jgi:hypothetical protein